MFKGDLERAPIGTYADLYQMVEQPAAKAIYHGKADDQINNKIGKLAESQDFAQHVIHKLI